MTKRVRIAMLMLLLALGAMSLMATPDNQMYVAYYTDDTYTTQCGTLRVTCTTITRTGCNTPYFIEWPLGPC